ncbi:MAG: hypothetical protein Q9195_006087 [Heterodermia aff. obscurata]
MDKQEAFVRADNCGTYNQDLGFTEIPSSDIKSCCFPTLDEVVQLANERGLVSLNLEDSEQLWYLCEQHAWSEYKFLQLAWALTLRCYTGNDLVCFGFLDHPPKPAEHAKDIRGDGTPYMHIGDLTILASDSFMALTDRFRSEKIQVRHQRQKSSSEQRSEPLRKTFDTIVVENMGQSPDAQITGTLSGLEFFQPTIIGVFQHAPKGITIELHYLTAKMSQATSTNIINTFQSICKAVVGNVSQPIRDLNVVSPRDLNQIMEWNQRVMVRKHECIHYFIERHALRKPRSPAIQSHDGDISYSELDEASNLVARHLVALGVGLEKLVPVCFEKSKWAVIAMIATLKAGGAFVPLDPSHPIERLGAIIQKTRASLVVSSAQNENLFRDIAVSTCAVGPVLMESLGQIHHTSSLQVNVQPNNAAFVLFTSGSTGEPKGIVQEHGSVCSNSLGHGPALGIDSDSRVLQFAAYTFDVSMMDIFTTLILGGVVCVPSEHDRTNDIVGFMNRMQINWAFLTPSFSNLIDPDDVPSLRTLAIGGEAVSRENIQRWGDRVTLLNCYGPAEQGTCIVSMTPMSSHMRSGTLGSRLNNARCWLVEPGNHDKLVPIGAIGELCLEGPTLAREYLDDASLTAASFITNPKWINEGQNQNRRFYKVGDLLRQTTNGSFDFIGRVDSQVKIRGQRVELGDVEHKLSSHPAVAACVAACPKAGPYQNLLVGVVQLRIRVDPVETPSPSPQDTSELQVLYPRHLNFETSELAQFMQERVPPYMIPSFWIVVAKIPLSASAKINRKKVISWLTCIDDKASSSQIGNAQGIGGSDRLLSSETMAVEISAQLAAVVASNNEHLRCITEGHNVVLREVGLDSIRAISLAMILRKRLGVQVGVEHLTHKDTSVRDVAKAVEEIKIGRCSIETTKSDLRNEWYMLSHKLKAHASARQSKRLTVFVTGAAGFLGLQILSRLFSRSDVYKVIAHVRADGVENGLNRIKKAAWWSESLLDRLEIWCGDLEQPKLGLSPSQWDRVMGINGFNDRVDAIIHNGASVRWNADFDTLKAANLTATVELLNAVIDSCRPPTLVYVSGGQSLKHHDETHEQMLANSALGNGYCQTKTVSELLVRELMHDPRYSPYLSIVKPSYIIGSPESGTANTTDFLWRLVASCIDIEAYNAEDQDAWLYISDVDRVSDAIVNSCCSTTAKGEITKILDGIRLADFWAILSQTFGYRLRPMRQAAWIDVLNLDIDRKHQGHKLWSLLDTLQKEGGKIGVQDDGLRHGNENSSRVRDAIAKNIEFLIAVGFLSPPPPRVKASMEEIKVDDEVVREKWIFSHGAVGDAVTVPG